MLTKSLPLMIYQKEKHFPPTLTTDCFIDSASLGKVFQHLSSCCCFSSASSLVTLRLCSRSDWRLDTLKSLHMASGFMIINVASVPHGWVGWLTEQGRYTVNRDNLLLQGRFIDIKQLQEVQLGRLIPHLMHS